MVNQTNQNETKLFKVKCFCTEKETEDGRKFKSYYTIIGDKSVNLKFSKDVEQVPKSSCMLYLRQGDGNLAKDKKSDKKYEIFWVSHIEKMEELEREVTDLSQYFEEV